MLWYRLVRCSSYYYYLGQWVSDKWRLWRAIIPGTLGMHEAVAGRSPRARRVKNGQPGSCLCKAAYKRPSATLVGNCQLGSLTTGSPAGHLNCTSSLKGEQRSVYPLFLGEGASAHCWQWHDHDG